MSDAQSNTWLLGNIDGDTGLPCARSRAFGGDWKMAPQETSVPQSLEPCMVKKNIFADAIKLRSLRQADFPGFSRQVLNAITCILCKKEVEQGWTSHRGESDLKTGQREILRCWPCNRSCGHKSGNAGSQQRVEEAGNRLSPKAPGAQPC